jgi:hypothetical protein
MGTNINSALVGKKVTHRGFYALSGPPRMIQKNDPKSRFFIAFCKYSPVLIMGLCDYPIKNIQRFCAPKSSPVKDFQASTTSRSKRIPAFRIVNSYAVALPARENNGFWFAYWESRLFLSRFNLRIATGDSGVNITLLDRLSDSQINTGGAPKDSRTLRLKSRPTTL